MDFAFTPGQQALKESTRRLAEERIAPIAEEADESPAVHRGLMAVLAESELLRYTVPEDYGGFGVKVMNLCIIREELARVSAQADTNFIMQGLGSFPITLGGTHEQKSRYLPPVARGESIAAFALTEPHAGSDVISMTTEATPDGDDWVLNGRKKFISQAGDASTYAVFAKTDPGQGSRSLSAFIVERGTPGFDDSKRLGPHGGPPHRRAGLRGLPYPPRQPHRRAGARAAAGLGHPRHLPHHGGRRRHRHGPGRLRGGAGLREESPHVRPAAQRLPGHPVQAGRHGRVSGRRPPAGPPGGMAEGPGSSGTPSSRKPPLPSSLPPRPPPASSTRRCRSTAAPGWRRATASSVSTARSAP